MTDTINNYLLPAFNNAQKFLVKLLCEYYEQKSENETNEIMDIYEQKLKLYSQIRELKSQVSLLETANRKLTTKLRSANNMIRILSKDKENGEVCKTPATLNICDVDRLFRKKLTFETEKIQQNQTKKVTIDIKNKKIESKHVTRKMSKPLNLEKEEMKNFQNNLKNIQVEGQNKETKLLVSKNKMSKVPSAAPLTKLDNKEVLKDNQIKDIENHNNVFESKKKQTVVKVQTKFVKKNSNQQNAKKMEMQKAKLSTIKEWSNETFVIASKKSS